MKSIFYFAFFALMRIALAGKQTILFVRLSSYCTRHTTPFIPLHPTFHINTLARPTPRELCGTGGTVINSTTVHHNGLDINIKTTTCPNLVASANSTSTRAEKREEEERQTASCSDGGCMCSQPHPPSFDMGVLMMDANGCGVG